MDRLFKEGRIKASMAVVKGANRHTKTGYRSDGVGVACASLGRTGRDV